MFSVVGRAVYLGGKGNTLGTLSATLFAKSEKYKSMRKLIIEANIFNFVMYLPFFLIDDANALKEEKQFIVENGITLNQ